MSLQKILFLNRVLDKKLIIKTNQQKQHQYSFSFNKFNFSINKQKNTFHKFYKFIFMLHKFFNFIKFMICLKSLLIFITEFIFIRIQKFSQKNQCTRMLDFNNSTFKTIIILILTSICLIQKVQSDDFLFSRSLNCLHISSLGHCEAWNQTTVLYRYGAIFYCFSADTYVLTQNGPVQMKDLKINDQIFGFNLQTGKNQFTPVTTWLHYDPLSIFDFNLIEIENSSYTFLGSKYHNFAFSNSTATQFKFVKDLHKGDSLVAFSAKNQQFKVANISKKVQKQGLFSPFTKSGTFYIFPYSNFNVKKYKQNNNEYPMILVHSLSQIKNPTENMRIARNYFTVHNIVADHYQPQKNQSYVNPLLNTYKFLFGNDWIENKEQKIAHRMYDDTSLGTSGSYNQQKRQHQKKKTIAVLAMNSILADILY